jgi:hypothetical protein
MTLGSLVSLALVEVLLRFRVVTAVQPGRAGSLGGVVEGVRLAVRHFGGVAGHVGLLRLAITGTHVLLVALPVAVARQIVVPDVSLAAHLFEMRQVCALLSLACVALIDGICVAFGTVYDARLFVALQKSEGVGRCMK